MLLAPIGRSLLTFDVLTSRFAFLYRCPPYLSVLFIEIHLYLLSASLK